MVIIKQLDVLAAITKLYPKNGKLLGAWNAVYGVKVMDANKGIKFVAKDGEVITAMGLTPEEKKGLFSGQVTKETHTEIGKYLAHKLFVIADHLDFPKKEIPDPDSDFSEAPPTDAAPPAMAAVAADLSADLTNKPAMSLFLKKTPVVATPISFGKVTNTGGEDHAIDAAYVPPTTADGSYPVLIPTNEGAAVSLRIAKGLYQAVRGTDSNSRYFLLADFGDLKLAVRWLASGKMSVRFEGEGIAKYMSALGNAGLGQQQDYASVHVQCDGLIQAQKMVGAMIFATGAKLLSPLPDVGLIKGQGT